MAAPITSSTYSPGMIVNQTPLGQPTNQQWIQAFVEYWASRWAHGDRTVPAGWISAQHGEPDPSDQGGLASPRTLLAFARYAQSYRPGMDPQVDQLMPWVAPGPNDFIEDPVVTAARIGNEQWQKDFDERIRQFNITTEEQARQFGLTLDMNYRKMMSDAFNQHYQNELARYATEAGIWSTQTQNALSLYNSQVGIWNSNEDRRLSSLGQAGSLASALQGMYDQRGLAAIQYASNPGDMVARENTVRGIQASKNGEVGVFQNVDALSEVIRRLIDYKPGDAPIAPTMPTAPTAPVQGTNPVTTMAPPNYTPPNLSSSAPAMPNQPQPTPHPNDYQELPPSSSAPAMPTTPAPTGAAESGIPGVRIVGGQIMRYATGTNPLGTTARKMIVGDPQADGLPNPELVEISGQNVRTKITPLKGTPGKGRFGKAVSKTMNGVQAFANGTNPPDTKMPTYDDSYYQNFPSLKYMQGGMNDQSYNRLSTGFAQGAFGTRIPESGRINYNKYLNVARDPVSLAALSSLYSSANRNLAAEVARARARAPLGQAIQSSLVRTV